MAANEADVTAPAPAEPEMVEIPDASNEDLDAFIAGETRLPEDNSGEQESGAPPVNAEPKPETPATSGESPSQPRRQLTPDEIKARAAASIKRVEGQEIIVQRALSKLGEFKKEITAEINEILQGTTEDAYLQDPRGAMRKELDLREKQGELRAVEAEEERVQKTAEAQRIVAKHIKPEEMFLEDMALALHEDGVPLDQARAFVGDPIAHGADGKFIVQVQRRARAERALRMLVAYTKQLQAEHADLKAKANGATGEVLRKIEQATNEPPRLNGKGSAVAKSTGKITEAHIPNLSDAELDELLR
jgi:hypothetical protein